MRILGIDPGSRVTGFGIIDQVGSIPRYVASGCIRVGHLTYPERLRNIYTGILEIITQYVPMTAAIEQVFVHKNVASALKLGQARGAAIVAMASGGLDIAEYAPRSIKKNVVGYGNADKQQIQHMVGLLLKIEGKLGADAADALAIAVCHGQMLRIKG
jgi:crossover junction endodeoxyribonuclease RuvC